MTTEIYIHIRQYLRELIRGTEWENHVFAVGGCCRDELMGHPIKDVDLAVNLPCGGIRFAEWLFEKGYAACKPVTFPTYGTAMLRLREFPDDEIEMVQTRKEKYTDHSRRNPETVFGSLKEDCLRRDLTINSLYYDISREHFVDITGYGSADIRNHIIRTPTDPDITYDDDPLRILRCIRFASRYCWEIEPETLSAMLRNVDRLQIITAERIQAEFEKMLTCNHPVMALELLRTTGAMRYVIPELCETFNMTQNRYHYGTVWDHTLKVVEGVGNSLLLRMAALLHDIGKIRCRTVDEDGTVHFFRHELESVKLVKPILRRLKYNNDFIRDVEFLVVHHMDLKHYGPEASSLKSKRLRKLQYICKSRERFYQMLEIIDADNKAHADDCRMPDQISVVRRRSEEMERDGSAMFGYQLHFNGDDVMKIKGLKPGPAVRDCLDYLLKLAFADPKRPHDEFLKHLTGYKPNERKNNAAAPRAGDET